MSLQKYFIRRAFLSKTKPKGFSNVANPKPALNLNEHINDVVVEAQSYSVTLDTTGPVSVTSGTTTTVNGGTGLTLGVTLGDIGLNATDGNIITAASLAITSTATAGDHTIAATAGDVIVNAGAEIILTPTTNLTFTLAAIPTFADEAAALAGSLTAGQVYKTAAGVLAIKL